MATTTSSTWKPTKYMIDLVKLDYISDNNGIFADDYDGDKTDSNKW